MIYKKKKTKKTPNEAFAELDSTLTGSGLEIWFFSLLKHVVFFH